MVSVVDSVFVFETAGASSNVVQVIVFKNGKPELAMNDAFKAYVDIRVTGDWVTITVPKIGANPEKVFRFPTGIQ